MTKFHRFFFQAHVTDPRGIDLKNLRKNWGHFFKKSQDLKFSR